MYNLPMILNIMDVRLEMWLLSLFTFWSQIKPFEKVFVLQQTLNS